MYLLLLFFCASRLCQLHAEAFRLSDPQKVGPALLHYCFHRVVMYVFILQLLFESGVFLCALFLHASSV